jgi:hypothetical protein
MSSLLAPIDASDVERCFPRLTAGFGAPSLRQQIDGFNLLLAEGIPEDASPATVGARLVRTGVRSPHVGLLNLLSLWSASPSAPEVRRLVARLVLVENALASVEKQGIAAAKYNSMLRDPEGLDQLVAELDATSALAQLGRLSAHESSSGRTASNYDIDWTVCGLHLRADVKWFQTSALSRSAEDELYALLALLGPDVRHTVYVSLERRSYSATMLANAALEVLELYEVAVRGKTTPGIDVSRVDDVATASRTRAPYPTATTVAGVREITVYLNEVVGPGETASFMVSPCGTGSADRDIDTIRRCLQSGASQVPRATSNRELAAIAVGSINPKDVSDVRLALYGQERAEPTTGGSVREPGLFSDDTSEVDLKHIDAVVFYSLRYVPRRRDVVVRRVVRVFARTRLGWRRRVLLLLWRWLFGRSRPVPDVSARTT